MGIDLQDALQAKCEDKGLFEASNRLTSGDGSLSPAPKVIFTMVYVHDPVSECRGCICLAVTDAVSDGALSYAEQGPAIVSFVASPYSHSNWQW